jgi:tripartite ATP-independent transporter DctP family solute receptor
MRRATWLGAATACAAFGGNGPAIVRAAPLVLEAKCGSQNVPAASSLSVRTRQAWQAIEQESDGAVKVQFFTDDSLGAALSQIEQLRLGAIQFVLASGIGLPALGPIFSLDSLGFAFRDARQLFAAYDGALGNRLRAEYPKFGLVPIGRFQLAGSFQLMTSVRAIRTPDDLSGLKIRVTQVPILVDLISALGSSPAPIPGAQAYTALQTHVVDGLGQVIEVLYDQHFYEILKYLSISNHAWATYVMCANADVWRGLPDRIKGIITRNIDKYALLQRADNAAAQTSLIPKFAEQGVAVNVVDQQPFRARLGSYYAKYKQIFGPDVWALLERSVGKLG